MNKNIAIYGAQLLAGTIYVAIKSIYGTHVSYFIVSNKSENPDAIDGIKVVALTDYLSMDINEQILIAAPEEYHLAIAGVLEDHGRMDCIFLTSQLRNQILEEYYSKQDEFVTLAEASELLVTDKSEGLLNKNILESVKKNNQEDFLKIYMARSSRDKALENSYILSDWIHRIQAGAILDDAGLGMLRDDGGDNISEKNQDFCELTALYWAWKNSTHEYTGLCHYRRVFLLQKQDIGKIKKIKPDVILPYPTIHFPDIRTQHVRYLSEEEWYIMHEAVLAQSPEMEDSWDAIWSGRYFYNYNMLIAKQEILNNYCDWLFGVLGRVDKLCRERKIHTSKRYAGYMGENLATLYFWYYRDYMKIIYTGVDILL